MHVAAMIPFQRKQLIISVALVTLVLIAGAVFLVPLVNAGMMEMAFTYDDQIGVHLMHNQGPEMNAYIDRLQHGMVTPLSDDNGIRTYRIPACAVDSGMTEVIGNGQGIIDFEFYPGFDAPIMHLVYSPGDSHALLNSESVRIVPGSISIIDSHWVFYKTP